MVFAEFQIERGTPLTWRDSGGSYDMTLASLGAGAGRQGAVADLDVVYGTTRTNRFYWRWFCQFATAPIVGERVIVYGKTGNGTLGVYDNDDGTGDIAVSASDKLRNVDVLKTMVVDEAAADVVMSIGGIVTLDDEDFMPIVWNGSAGDTLHGTAANNGFNLWPLPRGTE